VTHRTAFVVSKENPLSEGNGSPDPSSRPTALNRQPQTRVELAFHPVERALLRTLVDRSGPTVDLFTTPLPHLNVGNDNEVGRTLPFCRAPHRQLRRSALPIGWALQFSGDTAA